MRNNEGLKKLLSIYESQINDDTGPDYATLCVESYNLSHKELSELKDKYDKAVKALEFYADIANQKWSHQDFDDDQRIQVYSNVDDLEAMGDNRYIGKLARQTLKELGEL